VLNALANRTVLKKVSLIYRYRVLVLRQCYVTAFRHQIFVATVEINVCAHRSCTKQISCSLFNGYLNWTSLVKCVHRGQFTWQMSVKKSRNLPQPPKSFTSDSSILQFRHTHLQFPHFQLFSICLCSSFKCILALRFSAFTIVSRVASI